MWKTVKLGDVCDLQNGFAFKSSLFREKGLPILRISNIQNEGISLERLVYFVERDYDISFDRYKVLPNDLLIAMSGATTGKLGFNRSGEILYLNQRVGKFEPKSGLNNKYLYYVLSTKVEENLSISKGAAQPNLSTQQIKEIEFPLPPLEEQQRIVAKLDGVFAEVDRLIELASVKRAEAEKLKSALLAKMFKTDTLMYKEVNLGDVIEKTETVNPTSKFPNETFEYIDVSAVNREKLVIKETQTILGKDAPSRARRKVNKNDVIFATVRPTLKRVAVIPTELDGQICSTGYIVLRGKKDVLFPKYLFYWMTSEYVMNYMESVQTGASYPAVTDKQVKEILILLPSLDEQQRIVAKLDETFAEIDTIISTTSTTKDNYLALKAAILAQELQPMESEAA